MNLRPLENPKTCQRLSGNRLARNTTNKMQRTHEEMRQRRLYGYRQRLIREYEARDEGPRLDKWPEWPRQRLLNPYKSHDDRFKLFVFLWQNGMRPEPARYWVLWWIDKPDGPAYQNKVQRDLDSLVRDANSPMWTQGYYRLVKPAQFDVNLGRVGQRFREYHEWRTFLDQHGVTGPYY